MQQNSTPRVAPGKGQSFAVAPPPAGWPSLSQDAMHGIAGEIVRAIEPHTEADAVAPLVQFMACFGNLIGRSAHCVADGARHYLNIFVAIVGSTSKARKGTSFAQVRNVFAEIDAQWTRANLQQGLISGEGLINAVRGPVYKTGEDGEEVCVDEGVEDKRLLTIEAEFASVLKAMSRDANTLSAIIRNCWDSGNLQSLQRRSQLRATEAHVSIISHITQEELRRNLTATELANGFANRFLWVCARRSKLLPEGGAVDPYRISRLLKRLKEACDKAGKITDMNWDQETRQKWCEGYPELSKDHPGMFGCVVARSEAQVLRLTSLFALLDCSPMIRPVHLKAALALWQYCEDSALYLFGYRYRRPGGRCNSGRTATSPGGVREPYE